MFDNLRPSREWAMGAASWWLYNRALRMEKQTGGQETMHRKTYSSALQRTQMFGNRVRTWTLLYTLMAASACVSASGAFGQELPAAKPESVGMSAERLERIGAA